jgi:hypothetical protein
MGQCASRAFRFSSGRARAKPEVYSFPYETADPSNRDNGEEDRAARTQRIYSRGHSNPLASHPDLTKFADGPPLETIVNGNPQGGDRSRIDHSPEEHHIQGLEGAPICSLSLDNLNQYDRNTPSSAAKSTNTSARRVHGMTSRMPLIDTPTRRSGGGAGRRYTPQKLNRRSFTSLCNEVVHTLDQHAEGRSLGSDVMHAGDHPNRSQHDSWRALKSKDQNIMMGIDWSADGSRDNRVAATATRRRVVGHYSGRQDDSVER